MYPYELKRKYQYNFSSFEELSYVCKTNNVDISLSKDVYKISSFKPKIGKLNGDFITLSNPISVHPMEGFDGNTDGSPSELTKRRWMRFAKSGASLIWSEAIAVVPEGRTSDHQLWINEGNVSEYASLIKEMKKLGNFVIICQLTHSGRMSKNSSTPTPLFITVNEKYNSVRPNDRNVSPVDDSYLSSLPDHYAKAAALALKAGFDGVDVKACHGYLLGESLSAYSREGIYGGSFENRIRLMCDVTDAVKTQINGDTILGSRFGLSDMIDYPYGFGVTKTLPTNPDLDEPIKLLKILMDKGLSIIDMTMGSPYYNPYINRPANIGSVSNPEHPLKGLERLENTGYEIKKALPNLTLIGTGYSYLKEQSIYACAGSLIDGKADIIGFGRMAFAYDNFANDILSGKMDKNKSCISCGNCTKIMRAGGTTGCPVRDQEVYLPIFMKYCKGK